LTNTDRIKVLVWDGSGLVLVWKQLEGGAFRWPAIVDGVLRLTPIEFAALFDGIDWRRVQATSLPMPSERRSRTSRSASWIVGTTSAHTASVQSEG
jgi:transposase